MTWATRTGSARTCPTCWAAVMPTRASTRPSPGCSPNCGARDRPACLAPRGGRRGGLNLDDPGEFLASRSGEPLLQADQVLLTDLRERSGRLREYWLARLVEC
jgi:hypothetical protein